MKESIDFLRDYQVSLSLATRLAMRQHRVVLMNLQTGGGKTVTAGDIMWRGVRKSFKPVFLTDRIEIAKKSAETFVNMFGLDIQLINADTKVLYKADAYVAMAETFYRRVKTSWFPKSLTNLLFCDEAHTAVFNKIIQDFPHPYIVGLTATPVSASFKLNEVYGKMITSASTKELIRMGYLVPAIEKGLPDIIEAQKLKGEYTIDSQKLAFSQGNIDAKVTKLWSDHCHGRQTVWFNIDTEHNLNVQQRLRDKGISCQAVDSVGFSDSQRDEIFKAYERGEFQVLLNVGIAVKGWDSPRTSAVVFNAITNSMSKWRQAIGRGGRICHEIRKENFFIIDGGNNLARLGGFDDEIDWEHLFNNPEQDKNRPADPTARLCPICSNFARGAEIYLGHCKVCKAPLKYTDFKPLVKEMPSIIQGKELWDMNLKELQVYAKHTGKKPQWAWWRHNYNIQNRRSNFRRRD